MIELSQSSCKHLFICLLLLAASNLHAVPGMAQQRVIILDRAGDVLDVNLPERSASLSEPDFTNLLTRHLKSEGFLDAVVDSVSDTLETRRVYANPGCRYTLNNLKVNEIEGSRGIDQPVLFNPDVYTGQTFSEQLINEISVRILSEYESAGYMLAEFRIDSVKKQPNECRVDLFATADPGEALSVAGVRFAGVERNHTEYLVQVSGIRIGERITPDLISRGRRNLVSSGLFSEVSDGELVFSGGEPVVLYTVEEEQLNFFDGLIGYVPDAGGKGNLAGYGDILLRNTVADGNLFQLRYEQLQPLVSKLDIRGEQNYPAGLPIRIQAGFHFTQQDSSYLVRNMELSGGYRIFPGGELTGGVRAERSSVSEIAGGVETIDSRANFYSIGLRVRATDRYQTPVRGIAGEVVLERGRRFLSDERFDDEVNGSFGQTIAEATVQGYIPISRRVILSPSVQAMHIESEHFLITDLFRFGGAESLRGFREDQFRASSVAWGELEARYLIERDSYLFLFGAYGVYERPKLLTDPTTQLQIADNLISAGFGLAFDSPLGLMKFSYAVSPNEDLANGKVHVGIKTGL